ncbi:O-methyltransferase [Aquibacillus rhizosphaerae]|uniref:tRNA 5-hydroxyuridine methyltransferase n=1 Tax=Aquibacillus rhizosphaerae TaxID=3051431 RepID=A0ABT7L6H7_9BACI|nr:O-methyltransferase [Aquibacillus sp. LR5S19]MDL4841457.1 O-methyltransferase [Aquibacillus sp. LR5S19]
MDQQLEKYLTEQLDISPAWAKELEEYAKTNKVPIMEPLSIDFLKQIIRMRKPMNILEIGTAIGYSALCMSEANPQAKIVTIERDDIRYQEAVKNINNLNKQEKINVMFGDALEMTNKIKQKGDFDFLFIDAAKAQYKRFFELYSECLTEDAIIVSDNVLFKGLVAKNTYGNERLEKVAKKIKSYNEWLVNHPAYKTTILPIGDGIALSVKR